MTVWGFAFEVKRGSFFFVPTIVHTWKDCRCLTWQIRIGNLGFVLFRQCVHTQEDINELFKSLMGGEEQPPEPSPQEQT